MKIDLPVLLKTVGLPVGLVVVFGAVLMLIGSTLDQVLAIAGSLVGAALMIALLVDVLKRTGAVSDGTSGKWSAALNLIVLVGIPIVLKLKPGFDFAGLDAQLQTLATFGYLVLSYVVQIVSTQNLHNAYTHGLGLTKMSLTASSYG